MILRLARPARTAVWTAGLLLAASACATPAIPAAAVAAGRQAATVTRIVDGDTIHVNLDGRDVTVRYIGMDTPETVAPGRPVETGGREATEANRRLVEGRAVRLEKDVSETDAFGRLLRYVWTDAPGGEVMVNAELVRLGYAHVATYPPDVRNTSLFRELERQARAAGVGLWAASSAPAAASRAPGPASTLVITTIGYDGTVPTTEADEYVEIRNDGSAAQPMSGWMLVSVRGRESYRFPAITIEPRQTCRVYTNQSHPESCGLSWGRASAMWNNGGDRADLVNPQGGVVSSFGYKGY